MSRYIVKIIDSNFITHDVKRFVVERPDGYQFIPGQATELTVNTPEWKDKTGPFTFTGLRDWNYLEFMIKIYTDHKGLTELLGRTNENAELIISEPFGTIEYKEPGVFLAAGAGITPFIAIFRDLYKKKKLKGNRLIYSNKTSEDVIAGKELKKMFDDDFVNVYTREHTIGFLGRRIDRAFLIEHVSDFGQHFYVCGTDDFVKEIVGHLTSLGAAADTIIFEH